MYDNRKTLDELAIKYNTDKSSKHHNFTKFYDSFLTKIRFNSLKVLEIGVKHGASIKMWADYFENSDVYGADIQISQCSKSIPKNVQLYSLDQSNKQQLIDFFKKHGTFDVIIDDGSHINSHQIITFDTSINYLKSNGIYILEDLHTSLPFYNKTHIDTNITALDYLKTKEDLYDINYYSEKTVDNHSTMSMTSVIKKLL